MIRVRSLLTYHAHPCSYAHAHGTARVHPSMRACNTSTFTIQRRVGFCRYSASLLGKESWIQGEANARRTDFSHYSTARPPTHSPTHPPTQPPTHLPAQPASQPPTHPPTHTPLQHLASEERKMDPRKSARTHHGPQPPQHLAAGERKMDPGKSRHTPHGSQPLQHLASQERKMDPRLQASARHRKHSRRSTSLLMNKSWTREKYTHTVRIDALHRFALKKSQIDPLPSARVPREPHLPPAPYF